MGKDWGGKMHSNGETEMERKMKKKKTMLSEQKCKKGAGTWEALKTAIVSPAKQTRTRAKGGIKKNKETRGNRVRVIVRRRGSSSGEGERK